MTEEKRVLAGVGVVIFNKAGQFLMMKRLSKHAYGMFALPGGWMEFGESFEEAGAREVKEELGIDIHHIRILGVTNNFFEKENKHTVSIIMGAMLGEEMPQNKEPDKCAYFEWYNDWEEMPQPLLTDYKQYIPKQKISEYFQLNK